MFTLARIRRGLKKSKCKESLSRNGSGKRIIRDQIAATSGTQDILYRIIRETVVSPKVAARAIPNVLIDPTDEDTGSGKIDYTSEAFTNALLAVGNRGEGGKIGLPVANRCEDRKALFQCV